MYIKTFSTTYEIKEKWDQNAAISFELNLQLKEFLNVDMIPRKVLRSLKTTEMEFKARKTRLGWLLYVLASHRKLNNFHPE